MKMIFFKYFFGELVCLPLLFLCRPFCTFFRCLDSNPEGLVNDKIEIVLFLLSTGRCLGRKCKTTFSRKNSKTWCAGDENARLEGADSFWPGAPCRGLRQLSQVGSAVPGQCCVRFHWIRIRIQASRESRSGFRSSDHHKKFTQIKKTKFKKHSTFLINSFRVCILWPSWRLLFN